MSKSSSTLIENKEELLRYLKSRAHMYHLSNVFFRDFHYATLSFAESKGQKISYGDAEKLAAVFIATLEKSGILKPVKPGSWMLNYPEFKKISVRPAAPAKAAAPQNTSKPLASTQSASPGSSAQKAAADVTATV
jgi:hypothetical protein